MAGFSSTQSPMRQWLALAAIIVVLDQVTKWLIVGAYQLGDATSITSFFNIVRAHNTGAAFSFLAGASGWQHWLFIGLALAASAFIVWLLSAHGQQRMFGASLSLILGGAIGNVIDRVMHGHVIDFLDFHWPFLQRIFYGGHFPAFNVADAAITLGAIGIIVDELLRMRRPK